MEEEIGDEKIWVRDDFDVKNFETKNSRSNEIISKCLIRCSVAWGSN
jgi:hypothetical protein